ncbi:MAG: N-acetylmuramoyl-L-alanine amidase [Rickettsiaceae bacterium]|nr:N-acetylmuramoyl-L-alanine amidase [Rickettsiaceae bacterium]
MKINDKFSSSNYSIRKEQVNYIILHYTEMEFTAALEKLCDSNSEVSCHYLIKADGEVFRLVADSRKAWHAGRSHWQGIDELNESSIGIEIDNLGNEDFTQQQIAACVELCHMLKNKYNIKSNNIIGHSDIAPWRKIDPGIFFPWHILAQQGLGIWYDLNLVKKDFVKNKIIHEFADKNDAVKKLQLQLQQLGYKVEISGEFDQQTNFVIRSFQSHFNQQIIQDKGLDYYRNDDSLYVWDNISQTILTNLLK